MCCSKCKSPDDAQYFRGVVKVDLVKTVNFFREVPVVPLASVCRKSGSSIEQDDARMHVEAVFIDLQYP